MTAPCTDYQQAGSRQGSALGVRYTVPVCACGVDRADHDADALSHAPHPADWQPDDHPPHQWPIGFGQASWRNGQGCPTIWCSGAGSQRTHA